MSLLTGADLTAYQTLSADQAVQAAVTRVEAFICPGVTGSLTEATRVRTFRLLDDPRAPLVPAFGTWRLSARRLGAWPITGLTSVTVDLVDATGDCAFTRFEVTRAQDKPPFLPQSVVSVAYRTGFGTIPLPEAIRQAVFMTADALQANPRGTQSETLGDATVRHAALDGNGLPPGVSDLLAPYRLVTF